MMVGRSKALRMGCAAAQGHYAPASLCCNVATPPWLNHHRQIIACCNNRTLEPVDNALAYSLLASMQAL